jgi:hypothetical protein
MTVKNWSTTAASNASVDGINWAEGMVPGDVNGSARETMAQIKAWYDRQPINVIEYGADATGSGDSFSAINAAVTAAGTNGTVVFPKGLYLCNTVVNILAGQTWIFEGARFTLTSDTQTLFLANDVDDWQIIGPWTVTGNNGSLGATSGTASALKIVGGLRWDAQGPRAKNIKGWGVYIQHDGSVIDRAERGVLRFPKAFGCYRGIEIEAGTGAEYVTVVSPHIARCNIGMINAAGNTVVDGGSISDNTGNIKLKAGTNHGHGIFSGTNINHATGYNLDAEEIVNGYTFSGCHFYANDSLGGGAIFLDECKGIVIEGGVVDCQVYNYKGASSGLNFIRGAHMPNDYGFLRNAGANNGHDELIIDKCTGPGAVSDPGDALGTLGYSVNDPSQLYVLAKRAAASTQSISAGVLIFNTEVSDNRGVYDNATGIVTIPAGQGGLYRLTATVPFVGTAMSSTASYIEILVNGAVAGAGPYLPAIFGTTRLTFNISEDILLAAGDTIKLNCSITGTTPTHGGATWESKLSLQKLN